MNNSNFLINFINWRKFNQKYFHFIVQWTLLPKHFCIQLIYIEYWILQFLLNLINKFSIKPIYSLLSVPLLFASPWKWWFKSYIGFLEMFAFVFFFFFLFISIDNHVTKIGPSIGCRRFYEFATLIINSKYSNIIRKIFC